MRFTAPTCVLTYISLTTIKSSQLFEQYTIYRLNGDLFPFRFYTILHKIRIVSVNVYIRNLCALPEFIYCPLVPQVTLNALTFRTRARRPAARNERPYPLAIWLFVVEVWLPSESGSRSAPPWTGADGSGTISGSRGFTGQSMSSTMTSSAKLLLTASVHAYNYN